MYKTTRYSHRQSHHTSSSLKHAKPRIIIYCPWAELHMTYTYSILYELGRGSANYTLKHYFVDGFVQLHLCGQKSYYASTVAQTLNQCYTYTSESVRLMESQTITHHWALKINNGMEAIWTLRAGMIDKRQLATWWTTYMRTLPYTHIVFIRMH